MKLAGRVHGLDVVLGGHTHDALPQPIRVGRTLVVNSGSHGKFLSRLDMDVQRGRVGSYRYRLIPVLAQDVPADPEMAQLIEEIRRPYEDKLSERLAVSDTLLYRRGNFNGTFDELILDALLRGADAQIGFSPGFRWGITIVPGQEITLEDVYAHTAVTYPNTWVREMTGSEIHQVMEDVADNLFHPDPYYRQGGDMVRLGGLTYTIDPAKGMGRRIRDLRVAGRALEPTRRYKSTGWASLTEADGPPAWDVVAAHLRSLGRVKIAPRARVKVVGRKGEWMSRSLALAVALVGLALLPADAADDPLDERLSAFQVTPLGDQGPLPFKLESLDGKLVSLADVRGRVAMLYFWEST